MPIRRVPRVNEMVKHGNADRRAIDYTGVIAPVGALAPGLAFVDTAERVLYLPALRGVH